MTNGFKLIGISIRTTNQDNHAAKDIGMLWSQFFEQAILDKIPNKISSDIYAVYTNYKSNFTEEYTVIIGVPVSTLKDVPEGMFGQEFENDNFIKYIAKGKMPDAVVSTWMEIWRNDNVLNRAYSYDYEIYGAKCQDGENAEVEIFISVK